MTEFRYQGHSTRVWPQHQHPEAEGVLTADPGEEIEFGDQSPPADGEWYNTSSGEQYLGPPSQDVEADEQAADQGTGDAEDQED